MKRELDMEDVVRLLNLDYPVGRESVNVVCPVCKRKKLNINYRLGAYNCPACGEFSGGVLDMWAYHRNIDAASKLEKHKKAAKDIYSYLSDSDIRIPSKRSSEVRLTESEHADDLTIDKVYRELLSMLTLSNAHHQDLKRRGLSDEAIRKGMYKSYPAIDMMPYCARLLEKGLILEGVPGFYKSDGTWTFRNLGKGYLIPTFNLSGMIQGLQLRSSSESASSKYLTVSSSGLKCGTRGRALPHIAKGYDSSKVIITEGPLKANIISELTGKTVIAVLGVNSLSEIPVILDKITCDEILIAYDMDRFKNEYVLKAQDKLKSIICEKHIPFRELIWDERFKGLDDYLVSKSET